MVNIEKVEFKPNYLRPIKTYDVALCYKNKLIWPTKPMSVASFYSQVITLKDSGVTVPGFSIATDCLYNLSGWEILYPDRLLSGVIDGYIEIKLQNSPEILNSLSICGVAAMERADGHWIFKRSRLSNTQLKEPIILAEILNSELVTHQLSSIDIVGASLLWLHFQPEYE